MNLDVINLKLTKAEIDEILVCLDASLFNDLEDLSLIIDGLEEGLYEEDEYTFFLTNSIPTSIDKILDKIVLMTHVDPEYDAVENKHSSLYDLDKYLESYRELGERALELFNSKK